MKTKIPKFKKPKNLKMSKRSEKALDKSIEHWEMVRDESEGVGKASCKLCDLYNTSTGCGKCPVRIKNKTDYCLKTPYYKYVNRHFYGMPERIRKRLAQDEIDFLQTCYY